MGESECTDTESLFETRVFLRDFHEQPSRSLHVTGTRTHDLSRAQQPFQLHHWRFWDKVLTSFSKTCCQSYPPCYVRCQAYCYVTPQTLMEVSCESASGIRTEMQTFRLSPKLAVKFESCGGAQRPRASFGWAECWLGPLCVHCKVVVDSTKKMQKQTLSSV